MFRAAALIPSPPVLVPDLAGGRPTAVAGHPAHQVPPLRSAVLAAVTELAGAAPNWTVIGVADRQWELGPETVGTFRGLGVEVRAGLSDAAVTGPLPADPRLPLAVLVAGWVRGAVAPEVVARARLVDAGAATEHCLDLGAALRAELDADEQRHGVLVVADGAATLSTAAPGYLDERAAPVQERLDDALASGDRAALAALDAELCADIELVGRAAYQVLAGLFAVDETPPRVESRYRAAPFGVGYHVGLWWPGDAS